MTEKICAFIRDYALSHGGVPPAIREIRAALDISSVSMVTYHINVAISAGKLVRVVKGARGITHVDIARMFGGVK